MTDNLLFHCAVDSEWNCWLLEANAEPDFKQTGQRLRCVIDGLVEGTLQIVADPLADQRVRLCRDAVCASLGQVEASMVWCSCCGCHVLHTLHQDQ